MNQAEIEQQLLEQAINALNKEAGLLLNVISCHSGWERQFTGEK